MFGSVARGEAMPLSDIDLVAVFDDVEYQRRAVLAEFLRGIAQDASGRRVDLWLTDLPEWTTQRSFGWSFASSIADDLRSLVTGDANDGAVRWDKEQVMATSDAEAAYRRLNETCDQFESILNGQEPSARERRLARTCTRDELAAAGAGRLVDVCEASHMAVETALKALGCISGMSARVMRGHNIERLLDALADEDRQAVGQLALSEQVPTLGQITMWRSLGAYHQETQGREAREIATPQFTSAILNAAANVADYAADKIITLTGEAEVTAQVARYAREIRETDITIDIGTGEPLTATLRDTNTSDRP